MAEKVKRGLFITLEGVEGCGKSTQAERLCAWFEKQGLPVLLTEEPGGTREGEELRSILLSRKYDFEPGAELFLFEAIRSQHVNMKILPALESGVTVVCSRFCDATVAYQGYGRGLDIKKIEDLNRLAAGGLAPDLTFLIDLSAKLGLERSRGVEKTTAASGQWDRIESETLRFHNRIRKGYLALAQKEPERIRTVKGSLSAKNIEKLITGICADVIFKHH